MSRKSIVFILLIAIGLVYSQTPLYKLPLKSGEFEQQVHKRYKTAEGLTDKNVEQIRMNEQGRIVAKTSKGFEEFDGERFRPNNNASSETFSDPTLNSTDLKSLQKIASTQLEIRSIAKHNGEIAVAADNGLFLKKDNKWRLVLPQKGNVRWAPVDVRAVVYDASGDLWFAAPQGVGHRIAEGKWELFTGADGLPFNDFTCMAAGPKSIWFGTTNGAIQYRNGTWSFRQGGRWLLDNHVNDIVVDSDRTAWIATSKGVSCISYKALTLADKATFFEEEIEKYHLRTQFGYINPANLSEPGDKNTAVPVCSDNDGHFTGTFLAAMSLAYAATGDPKYKQKAHKAFEAVVFLSTVTQGGTHPAPKGFFARAVRPTSGPDPHLVQGLEYDLRRVKQDALWKIIQPRWPIDETGEWYWKNDSSVDELDGHFLGYGTYYDHVCKTEAEKERVRKAVSNTIDHILDNGYNLVDYDGNPTRWGRLSPDDINRDPGYVVERGLRSLSFLNYLLVTHHITNNPRYRKEYLKLAYDHGYGMNGMTQPRNTAGVGTEGQGDDKMMFMNYYHLLRYETDPTLLSMYYWAIRRHWELEKYEKSPWVNFIYAACCMGKVRTDHWRSTDLTPPKSNFEDALETLKLYPLDLIMWPTSNAHRTDLVLLKEHLGHPPGTAGLRVDGYVFPVDERYTIRWGTDPFTLTSKANGTILEMGLHFLVAYYMGLVHGFIE